MLGPQILNSMATEMRSPGSIGAALKGPDGTIFYFNHLIEDAFKISHGKMAGLTDFHLLPDSEAQAIRKNDRLVIESGQTLRNIEKTTLPDGQLCYWLVERFRVDSPNGYLLAILAAPITDLVRSVGLAAAEGLAHRRMEGVEETRAELINIAAHI